MVEASGGGGQSGSGGGRLQSSMASGGMYKTFDHFNLCFLNYFWLFDDTDKRVSGNGIIP